jgi:hypothetical protein
LVAQTSAPGGSDNSQLQADLKKLLNATEAQQKAIAEQQKQITEQQKQITEQQAEIEKLKQQLAQPQTVSANNDDQSAHVVNATLTAPNTNPAARAASDAAAQKESPLSFRIGGAEFTPGGFMDFTSIFRSVNTGNSGGTNFFAIPFSNTTAGHLTETRFTAQNSRVNLKATSKFGENDITGFFEMDFLGNDAANVFVTSNSHTMRLRHYYVDFKRGKWEILAGQTWGWLTPNRVGLSPNSADVFYSQNSDFNYQVGLTWTRAPQFRVAYHPNTHWALGVAFENPEQFGGQGEITFPSSFNAQLSGQIDQANISSTPNLHPDVIPKIAYDTDMGGKHFHAEVAGLLTSVKVTNLPTVSGAAFVSHIKTGGGVESAINLELLKGFRVVASGFLSDGGGRYIFGMGPDVVARPINAAGQTCTNVGIGTPPVSFTGVGCDIALSMVHSGSGLFGFEGQITPKTMIYGYYGGAYFQRNFAPDTTGRPGTLVGFGYPGSANNNNRAIQEPTLGWVQTFWRNPQYGAVQLITQFSYVTRAPWFVPAGAPKNAHLGMGWVDLRYVLP